MTEVLGIEKTMRNCISRLEDIVSEIDEKEVKTEDEETILKRIKIIVEKVNYSLT